ncbi:MAG: glycoside hydrolase family 2 protein [Ruminococcaceae bacterium]|nr:glycoside hydrolase family 2 protein [Oscillospiraceae bacterium]
MMRINLNENWQYTETYTEDLLNKDFNTSKLTTVRTPHTCKEISFNYFDEEEYQFVCGYRKAFVPKDEWKGKNVLLTFDGVAHFAEVFLNGKKIGEHNTGYTAFTFDITNELLFGEENFFVVKVDTRESLNIPPFGFVIDYLTYGGIYREVYIDIKEQAYLLDVFTRSSFDKKIEDEMSSEAKLRSTITIAGDLSVENLKIKQSLFDGDELIVEKEAVVENESLDIVYRLSKIILWNTENPHRYSLVTELYSNDKLFDKRSELIGIRKIEFKADGFYLNDKKTKIRGLNRHQSYAYVGYAMPESMQRFDAKILKEELGCNSVRTSHYPQSKFFIDECDKIGLLVFIEIPGWQYIGDDAWKEQSCKNVEEMVLQYRNNPSIILWGVRINESNDDDEFYKKTNEIAKRLDDSRPTAGVRCIKKSSLLEDVYTYNDFVHRGINKGCEPKRKITSDMSKAYMVTEYNGHMFPTKNYDCEEHRCEHMLRHAKVVNDIYSHDDIAGSYGWCMFDYNTHKDFGSGDKICHHGVMDMFRNPKLAAAVYAVWQDEHDVLEISSSMDIGEHPMSSIGKAYIITNADSVKMYKNGRFIKEYFHGNKDYPYLKNAPILIDDFVGDAIYDEKKLTGRKQADFVKDILNHIAVYNYDFTASMILKAIWCIMAYGMRYNDAAELATKYIGNWGSSLTEYKFEAIKNGKTVKTVTKTAAKTRKLEALVSNTRLCDETTYDVAAIRIRMCDEYGNILPFYNGPIAISTKGGIEIIGPNEISLQGGMGGTYVKTTGKESKGVLEIKTNTGEKASIDFEIIVNKENEI